MATSTDRRETQYPRRSRLGVSGGEYKQIVGLAKVKRTDRQTYGETGG